MMLKRISAGILALCCLVCFAGCSHLPWGDPDVSSSEPPVPSSTDPYSRSSLAPSSVVIPDYSADITKTVDFVLDNTDCRCDPAFAALTLEITQNVGTDVGYALLPRMIAGEMNVSTAKSIAQYAVAAVIYGADPAIYVEGLDMVAALQRMQSAYGWFSATPVDAPAEPETVPDAPENAEEDTFWSILALSLCNAEFDEESACAWLLSRQHRDGGFGNDSSLSYVAYTGMALTALSFCTCDDAKEVFNGAVSYLLSAYNEQGFFVSSDTSSVATARDQAMGIAGVIAAGENIYAPRWIRNGRNMVDGLLTFRAESGCFDLTEGDVTDSNIALFALWCAQNGGLVFRNYQRPDIPVEPAE